MRCSKKIPGEEGFPRGGHIASCGRGERSVHCHHATDIWRGNTFQDIPHVLVIDPAGVDGIILFFRAEKDFTQGLESSDDTGETAGSRIVMVPWNKIERDVAMLVDGDKVSRGSITYGTAPFGEASDSGADHAVAVACDAECRQRIVFRIEGENRRGVFIGLYFHCLILSPLDSLGGMLDGEESVSTGGLEDLVVEVPSDAGAGAIPVVEADPPGKLSGDIIKVHDEPKDILFGRLAVPGLRAVFDGCDGDMFRHEGERVAERRVIVPVDRETVVELHPFRLPADIAGTDETGRRASGFDDHACGRDFPSYSLEAEQPYRIVLPEEEHIVFRGMALEDSRLTQVIDDETDVRLLGEQMLERDGKRQGFEHGLEFFQISQMPSIVPQPERGTLFRIQMVRKDNVRSHFLSPWCESTNRFGCQTNFTVKVP